MPSLHAMDAFIVGIVMASVCRSQLARIVWLAWPAWVWFSVLGTGNHFWLDCAAGVAVALATDAILLRERAVRRALEPRRA
jgi:membrane-associated phospholipid phosphatase